MSGLGALGVELTADEMRYLDLDDQMATGLAPPGPDPGLRHRSIQPVTISSKLGRAASTRYPSTASRMAAVWSRLDPQHAPTIRPPERRASST